MTKGRETTQEERPEIVEACIVSGNDYGGTARGYQVSYQQVYTWTKKYREIGKAGFGRPAWASCRDAANPDTGREVTG